MLPRYETYLAGTAMICSLPDLPGMKNVGSPSVGCAGNMLLETDPPTGRLHDITS